MTKITFPKLPITRDIAIKQGEQRVLTFEYAVNGTVVDISSWSAKLMIKSGYNGILYDTRETGGAGIVLSSAGIVTITWSGSVTAAFTFTHGIYDLRLLNGTVPIYLAEGSITVTPRVTT